MSLLNSEERYTVGSVGQKGVGLFAAKGFSQGEGIYQMDYWSKPLMPMHATNHSCDPNSSFNADGMLMAIRDIRKDEEITYDYLLHPIPASPWNFECQCQSIACIKWVLAE
ncbi:MAG: SET domain-containing protein [Acidobacteriota bacterium]